MNCLTSKLEALYVDPQSLLFTSHEMLKFATSF